MTGTPGGAARPGRTGGVLVLSAPIAARVAQLDQDGGLACGNLHAVGPGALVTLCRAIVAGGGADSALQLLGVEAVPVALVLSVAAVAAFREAST